MQILTVDKMPQDTQHDADIDENDDYIIFDYTSNNYTISKHTCTDSKINLIFDDIVENQYQIFKQKQINF